MSWGEATKSFNWPGKHIGQGKGKRVEIELMQTLKRVK